MSLPGTVADIGVLAAYLCALGLAGWLAYLTVGHRVHYGLSALGVGAPSDTDPAAMTNCAACGARNGEERSVCRYCSEPLDGEGDGDDR
ncbi:hypothetical protein [Halosimplex marinum]|uniref:hypothetical protein n=1 Tax=Halosimplex marinum TaxID=3396620 RepID=UPI003F55929D